MMSFEKEFIADMKAGMLSSLRFLLVVAALLLGALWVWL